MVGRIAKCPRERASLFGAILLTPFGRLNSELAILDVFGEQIRRGAQGEEGRKWNIP